jgi:hypothetical protein
MLSWVRGEEATPVTVTEKEEVDDDAPVRIVTPPPIPPSRTPKRVPLEPQRPPPSPKPRNTERCDRR